MTPLKPWGSFQFREERQLKTVEWEVRFRENFGIFVLSSELCLFFMGSSTILFGGRCHLCAFSSMSPSPRAPVGRQHRSLPKLYCQKVLQVWLPNDADSSLLQRKGSVLWG